MSLTRFSLCLSLTTIFLAHGSAASRVPAASVADPNYHVMPVPAALTPAPGKLEIRQDFHAQFTGYVEPRLTRGLERFIGRLQARTGIRFAGDSSASDKSPQLLLQCAGPGEAVQSVRADESYELEIDSTRARLTAPSPLGILHGFETLLQLVGIDAEAFYFPALSIQDRPRFPWRGLMIDAARHWQPVEVIKRNLDAMAVVKMNVLHWHLSDDQGFRVESKRHPKLQQLGSDGFYYTQAEIRDVVAYARDRGIRVVPEFDMPGHTTSWFPGYPSLASAPGPYQIERKWGVFDPVMDPTRKEVYSFLDSFLGEITPLFPDEYWHIGGDEVNGRQWDSNGKIAEFKTRHGLGNDSDLQAYFNKELMGLVAKHGKKVLGWDEILHPDLPKSAVIQAWRNQAALAHGAQQGYAGIRSSGYYLDHLLPASTHYLADPLGQDAASLTPAQQALILGGEACMWGEYLTSENIDSRIWPRAAAIAERFWSPQEVRDVDDMYRRLAWISRDLEAAGSTHSSVYPRMLQRMTSGPVPEALMTLGDIVESVKRLGRGRLRSYTSLTPMNRLTDAVPPESDRAREFNREVDLALASPDAFQRLAPGLRSWLTLWRDNHSLLQPYLQTTYLLRELEPLSENVAALSAAGLQALEYLQTGSKPPESWTRAQAELLKRAARPEAELLIMTIDGVRRLVTAANQLQ